MPAVSKTSRISLNARPAEVFSYVSDLTHHPEWSGGPLSIEAVSAGPVTVGSRYHSRGGQKDKLNELTVTAYEPPVRFAFIAKDPEFGEVTHEFIFQARDGGTLLERKITGTMPPMVAVIWSLFLYPLRGKPSMDKAMANLKAKFEQPSK